MFLLITALYPTYKGPTSVDSLDAITGSFIYPQVLIVRVTSLKASPILNAFSLRILNHFTSGRILS